MVAVASKGEIGEEPIRRKSHDLKNLMGASRVSFLEPRRSAGRVRVSAAFMINFRGRMCPTIFLRCVGLGTQMLLMNRISSTSDSLFQTPVPYAGSSCL